MPFMTETYFNVHSFIHERHPNSQQCLATHKLVTLGAAAKVFPLKFIVGENLKLNPQNCD